MAVLLQHLKLLNQGKFSPPKDYSFSNGTLSPADEKEKVNYNQVIDCSNYLASKGWVDLRCGLGEPGQEYRETVASLCAALQAGGFAKAVVLPNTDPVIQSKTEVAFLKAKAAAYLRDCEAKHVYGDVYRSPIRLDRLTDYVTEDVVDAHES